MQHYDAGCFQKLDTQQQHLNTPNFCFDLWVHLFVLNAIYKNTNREAKRALSTLTVYIFLHIENSGSGCNHASNYFIKERTLKGAVCILRYAGIVAKGSLFRPTYRLLY